MSFVAVPGTRIGDYVVVSEIGRGGMAVVYLAEHPNLGRKVALKLLADKLSDDDRFRERFMREARIAAGIEHPNIVPIHDAGEAEGLLFIAMRYVEGIDLARLLEREESLPLVRTQTIVSQIAAALDAAHSKGLVHRDVKPPNVLLASGEGPGGEDHVYLADFGLARPQIGSDLTHAGELYGTFDYMAPEQFDGRPLDARTDVYALACVAYECLTGEAPFRRESSLAKAAAHLKTRPVPPSERNAELSKEIDEAILRGLAKDKSNRYEHAGQLAAALVSAIGGGRPKAATPKTPIRTELSAPIVPVEERKVLTVLACTIESGADMDPEDWRVVLSRATSQIVREIERFGGTALGSMAGTITGVFGVPAVHEDDAERAVRAALRILDEVAEPTDHQVAGTEVRIGISTGQALVTLGTDGSEGRVAGSVIGDAARLGSEASQGQVVVDRDTWALTSAAVVYEPFPDGTALDGGEPLALSRAIHLIARTGTGERDRTAFVGRDPELSILTQLFERSRRRAATELVTIVAEPGLGKSRLVRELARHVDALPELITWREGRCLPYGEGITFWALGEILKAHAGILESDPSDVAQTKLDTVLPQGSERAWFRQRLLPLIGIEPTSLAEREELFTAWRRFIEQIAEDDPTVLVFEDLHWADDAMLAFLEYLADCAEGVPLLVVGTARPELFERRRDYAAGLRNATPINLSPLSQDETVRLTSALLQTTVIPADLQQPILDRAGGNPLYAEEFVRLLIDRALLLKKGSIWELREGAEVPFPDSVQALIAARLDTLGREAKSILADAAVVGKVFWSGAVAAMGERDLAEVTDALRELSRKELVRPARRSSIEGEAEYAFWHILTRDVAYSQLPRASRASRHVAAAAWIESKASERVEDLADVLAYHYATALELTRASGQSEQVAEFEVPALRFLTLAGDRALGLDTATALGNFERALALTPSGHPERPEALARFGEAAFQAGRFVEAAEALEEAVAAFRARGDIPATTRAMATLSITLRGLGDQRWKTLHAEALVLLEPLPPGLELVGALTEAAAGEALSGRPEAGISFAERALALGDELRLQRSARALGFRGFSRSALGDSGGLQDMREAITLATQAGQGREVALLHNNLGVWLWAFEGPAASLEVLRAGISFGRARGLAEMVDGITAGTLDSLIDSGEFDEALEIAAGLAERLEVVEDVWDLVQVRAAQARILGVRGQAAQVAGTLDWIESTSRAGGSVDDLVLGLGPSAFARAALEQSERAAGLLSEIETTKHVRECYSFPAYLPAMVRTALGIGLTDLAERLAAGVRPLYPYAEHALIAANAALIEAHGDLRAATDGYAEAAARWERFGVVPEQGFALLGQGRCLVGLARPSEAVPVLRQAREIFERLGARPTLADTDVLLMRASADSS